MAIQMIFCLETNKRADTDYIYVKEVIDYLYQIGNKVRISPIYMGTKTKYRSGNVLKQIAQKKKAFTIGQTKIIYCIDTDDYEKNAKHEKELRDIGHFCKENGYDLIWFCHDVEEVFLGQKVSNSQKVKEASAYRVKKRIKEKDLNQLSSRDMRIHTSNILCILDQYLKRK